MPQDPVAIYPSKPCTQLFDWIPRRLKDEETINATGSLSLGSMWRWILCQQSQLVSSLLASVLLKLHFIFMKSGWPSRLLIKSLNSSTLWVQFPGNTKLTIFTITAGQWVPPMQCIGLSLQTITAGAHFGPKATFLISLSCSELTTVLLSSEAYFTPVVFTKNCKHLWPRQAHATRGQHNPIPLPKKIIIGILG